MSRVMTNNSSDGSHLSTQRQQGLVLVLSLLMLVSLTILGVSAVTSSLLQNKMAVSMETQSLAFDAAEAAIAAVAFESEDATLLSEDVLTDPLSQARQGNQLDPEATDLSCFDDENWTDRTLTEDGLTAGSNHTVDGNYNAQPEVQSWSKTAFVTEQSCLGSSNVQGGANISCHIFLIRGCGQMSGGSYAVANTLNASTFAPAAE
jgi:type IV pilus assembly protein PilX